MDNKAAYLSSMGMREKQVRLRQVLGCKAQHVGPPERLMAPHLLAVHARTAEQSACMRQVTSGRALLVFAGLLICCTMWGHAAVWRGCERVCIPFRASSCFGVPLSFTCSWLLLAIALA